MPGRVRERRLTGSISLSFLAFVKLSWNCFDELQEGEDGNEEIGNC